MKLTELSNPTAIADKFKLIYERKTVRKYQNIETGYILSCGVYGTTDSEYIFTYNRRIDMQNHADKSLALSIFKTVLYDVKKYIIDAGIPVFYFSSEIQEQSRLKLYDTLSRLLEKVGYLSITRDNFEDFLIGDYIESVMSFYDRTSMYNERAYVFVKKNSNIIPLDEVRNPSKPSDKFRLAHTSDFGYSKSYTYYSKYDINDDGDKDILDIGFHSIGTSQVTITFELNGTDEQSPEYAHLAMAVFQTVLYQVTQYVNKYAPTVINFSASPTEPTRVSLYKRICKNIQGYTVKEENGWFELTKIQ